VIGQTSEGGDSDVVEFILYLPVLRHARQIIAVNRVTDSPR